jgi:membrane protease YdiL (CAAX protease family)
VTTVCAETIDPAARRRERLAILCVVVWTLSALISRQVGLWFAVGGTGFALGILAAIMDRHSLRKQLRVAPGKLGIGLGAGLLMTVVTYLVYPTAVRLVPEVVREAALLYTTFGRVSGWQALVCLPVVVLGEDLVWRAVVQDALAARKGPMAGVILATLLYALAVVPAGMPLLVAIALGCGLFWSALKAWTGSLVPVLLAHLLWDMTVIMLNPLTSPR